MGGAVARAVPAAAAGVTALVNPIRLKALLRAEHALRLLNVRSIDRLDRTTSARIRDAALVRFAEDGFAAATVRAIAADAGVSPGLVIHHFGSKEGLQRACEDYLLAVVEQKFAALDSGGETLSAWTALVDERLPLLPFLGRVLSHGGESAVTLLRAMIAGAARTLEDWERQGRVRPSADPPARAVVLVSWDLSRVLLGEQIRTATGIDPGSGLGLARLSLAALEIYTDGLLLGDQWTSEIRSALQAIRDKPPDTDGTSPPSSLVRNTWREH